MSEPVVVQRVVRRSYCFVDGNPKVIDIERFKIYKAQKPLLKKIEEDEFMKACRDWNT